MNGKTGLSNHLLKRVSLWYLILLAFHVGHILEEIWGRFRLLDRVFGPLTFMLVNWVLFCLAVAIFYQILIGRRWAHALGMLYSGIMVFNGIGHNLATLITGRYFGGFAGGLSGLGLIASGIPLYLALNAGRRAPWKTSHA